jgi:hypothetical protein
MQAIMKTVMKQHPTGMQRPVENAAQRAERHPVRDGILLTADFNLRNVETLHATSLLKIKNNFNLISIII